MTSQDQFSSPERDSPQPQGKPSLRNIPSAIPRYGLAVVSVALAIPATLFLQHHGFRGVAFFLFAIALTVWYAGAGPTMLASVLSILCFKYFFSPPIYSLAFSVDDVAAMVILLSFAVLIIRFSAVRRRIEGQLLQARDELQLEVVERTRQTGLLRRSEAYLAEAQRLNRTGSWAVKPPANKSHYWSDEMFRIYGFDPQHGIPDWQSSMERVHPDDRDRIRQAVRQVLEGHVTVHREGEHRLVLPDGTAKYVHIILHPVFDHAGHVIEYVGSTVDVTERKRSEQERERLRQLEADLARLNRVSMMGELAASLAHEIKQPITAVATNAEIGLRWLQREPPDAGEVREALSRIVNAAKRAADITDRNRSLYGQDTPKRETVNLNEVVREMTALLKDAANQQSVSIRAELDGDVPPMTADRVQMQQVLMNLMLNGIEAMKDTGGELTIRSKRTEGGQVLLSVSDVGWGLPGEKADRVFDAFFTTKAQGTGMGLSICRRIIESHGGRLWACANTARGATFHFTLPNEASMSSTSAG